MLHRNPVARLVLPAFTAVAFALTGCAVDNSGGEPPAGETVEFEVAIANAGFFCEDTSDAAHLIKDEAGIDAFIEACGEEVLGDEATIEEDLIAELALLEDGQALVLVSAELGGCLGPWAVDSVYMDGEILRPWMLKGDSAYGRTDMACTADIGQDHQVLRVDGAAAATSIELTVGIYNPDLPGAPYAVVDDAE